MIPEQTYPELGELIKGVPQLFKHSEIIGVFLGDEICASFMHSADHLDKVVFYENFIAIPNPKHQEHLKQLYNKWEETVPNLTVSLNDGVNFDVTSDFVYHDMHMGSDKFLDLFRKKLQNSLIANCGFGGSMCITLEYARYIDRGIMFPVLLYRDILFYTFNKEKKDELFETIHSFLLTSNLVFDINDYYYGKVIKLKCIGNYDDRLEEVIAR
jgi:hypothetical protein